MREETQQYHAPQCRRLGTVQELTRQSHVANSDTPHGNNNTAYPPVS
jgi:hypothetical protein